MGAEQHDAFDARAISLVERGPEPDQDWIGDSHQDSAAIDFSGRDVSISHI